MIFFFEAAFTILIIPQVLQYSANVIELTMNLLENMFC